MAALAEIARDGIKWAIADQVVDSVRRAAHASHEARLFKTIAEDALGDGVHAATRAIKAARRRVVENLGDVKDDAVRGVKRQPLIAVGAAFAAGLAIGAIVGWAVERATGPE
jgi:hypothetical protein